MHSPRFLLAALLIVFPKLAISQTSFEKRADSVVSSYATSDRFWGTVLVAKNGRVEFEKPYGIADIEWDVRTPIDAKYEIASLTKAFTAMAIVQLEAAGKLRTSDHVAKYYQQTPASWNRITIEELLTHTSGLPNNELRDFNKGIAVADTPDELIATFRDRPLKFTPGTDWSYTNTEYYLLAYIVEKVSGEKYGPYLAHHIFEPLGMKNSGVVPTTTVVNHLAQGYAHDGAIFRHRDYFDRSLEIGAGGVYSTASDMLRWNQALDASTLVPASYMQQIFTAKNKGDYGYGWFVTSDHGGSRIWHEGSDPGYAAFVIRRPLQQLFIIVLSNIEDAPVREIASKLENRTYAALSGVRNGIVW
jgi:CubicO group peptidase (beta-lactamase class C family)